MVATTIFGAESEISVVLSIFNRKLRVIVVAICSLMIFSDPPCHNSPISLNKGTIKSLSSSVLVKSIAAYRAGALISGRSIRYPASVPGNKGAGIGVTDIIDDM